MRRDVRIELRLTEAEAEELRRRAASEHRSLSGYLRAQALQDRAGVLEAGDDR